MCAIFWLEKLNETECLENTDSKVRIILKWVLNKYDQGHVIFIRDRTSTRIF